MSDLLISDYIGLHGFKRLRLISIFHVNPVHDQLLNAEIVIMHNARIWIRQGKGGVWVGFGPLAPLDPEKYNDPLENQNYYKI
jgi:hypothetical protein